MRLAHIADLHLGFRQHTRLTPSGKNQREADVALAFTRAVDGAIAAAPDVVVLAGDLFHAVRPTNDAVIHAVIQCQRLLTALPGVPVIAIAGNHDTPRSSDTASIFGLLHAIGVTVAADKARRLVFPALDLSLLAVPHAALYQPIALTPDTVSRYQVLVTHGEVPGLFPAHDTSAESGGAPLTFAEGAAWDYTALGHYHVTHEVAPRCWYSGSLDYVSSNPWGERRKEAATGRGKGWLLVDLETGVPKFHPIEPTRRFIDLPWLSGAGLSADVLQRGLEAAIAGVEGGIEGAVVRQVVTETPREVSRALTHTVIRRWKAEALHYQLDVRVPEKLDQQKSVEELNRLRRMTVSELFTEILHRRAAASTTGITAEALQAKADEYLAAADAPATTAGAL